MLIDAIRRCLLRDLDALAAELAAYPNDASVWAKPAGAPNSAGTLTLHLVGNLRHFVGATLGATGYVRDRDSEFAGAYLPRAELAALIAAARAEVDTTLAGLDLARLDEPFPLTVGGGTLPTGRFLVHLAGHLAYHLGQLDYHRRLVTGDGTGIGAMALAPLF